MNNVVKDAINPSHYKDSCSIECIEAMEIAFGPDAIIDFCLCNAFKYLWRHTNKNGIEDLKKAAWYVDRARKEIRLVPEHSELYSDKILALSKNIAQYSKVLGGKIDE